MLSQVLEFYSSKYWIAGQAGVMATRIFASKTFHVNNFSLVHRMKLQKCLPRSLKPSRKCWKWRKLQSCWRYRISSGSFTRKSPVSSTTLIGLTSRHRCWRKLPMKKFWTFIKYVMLDWKLLNILIACKWLFRRSSHLKVQPAARSRYTSSAMIKSWRRSGVKHRRRSVSSELMTCTSSNCHFSCSLGCRGKACVNSTSKGSEIGSFGKFLITQRLRQK